MSRTKISTKERKTEEGVELLKLPNGIQPHIDTDYFNILHGIVVRALDEEEEVFKIAKTAKSD